LRFWQWQESQIAPMASLYKSKSTPLLSRYQAYNGY